MAKFTVDKGILKLIAQVDAAAPNRSKASDGTIGDAAHQERDSDHNPESPPPPGNPDNQVDAGDITHDPLHNADMGIVSEAIRVSKDRRVAYVIFDHKITGPNHNWQWDPYTGTDPHVNHMHVSVNDTHHDETQDWSIGIVNETDFQALIWRVKALEDLTPIVTGGPVKGEKVTLTVQMNALTEQIRALGVAIAALNKKFDDAHETAGTLHVTGDLTVS